MLRVLCVAVPALALLAQLVTGWGYVTPDIPLPSRWAELYSTCEHSNVSFQAPLSLVGIVRNLSLTVDLNGGIPGSASSAASGLAETAVESLEPIARENWTIWSPTVETTALNSVTSFRVSGEKTGLLQASVENTFGSNTGIHLKRADAPDTETLKLSKVFVHDGAEHGDVMPATLLANGALDPVAEIQWLFESSSGAPSALICQPLYSKATSVVNATDSSSTSYTFASQGFLSEFLVALETRVGTTASTIASVGSATVGTPVAATAGANSVSGVSRTTANTLISISTEKHLENMILPAVETEGLTSVGFGSFISYNGSLTMPPCTQNVEVIVSQHSIGISATELALLRSFVGTSSSAVTTATGSQGTNLHGTGRRPMLEQIVGVDYSFRALSVANTTNITEIPPTIVEVENDTTNQRLRQAIIALAALAVAELGLIVGLLLVRYEFFDLPTAWGGLARVKEHWVNPPTHHSWEDVETDSDDEDGDDDEDEEDDEEEEEEEDEEGLLDNEEEE